MSKRWVLQEGVHTIRIDLDVVSEEDKTHVLQQVAESGREIDVIYFRSSELKHDIETHRCKDCFS